jgi:hypothetical protein
MRSTCARSRQHHPTLDRRREAHERPSRPTAYGPARRLRSISRRGRATTHTNDAGARFDLESGRGGGHLDAVSSMSRSLEQVRSLLARATGTPYEEEARTSALIAARALIAGGFEIHESGTRDRLRALEQSGGGAARTAQQLRFIRARFMSRCRRCGRPIYPGDHVGWLRGGGCFHPWCLEARAT